MSSIRGGIGSSRHAVCGKPGQHPAQLWAIHLPVHQQRLPAPKKEIEDVELSGEEYARLNELHGSIRLGRMTMHQRLDSLMNTQKYDFGRQKTPDLGITEQDNHRIKMIKDVVSEYGTAAREQLLRENKGLFNRIYQNRIQKHNALRGKLTALIGQ